MKWAMPCFCWKASKSKAWPTPYSGQQAPDAGLYQLRACAGHSSPTAGVGCPESLPAGVIDHEIAVLLQFQAGGTFPIGVGCPYSPRETYCISVINDEVAIT